LVLQNHHDLEATQFLCAVLERSGQRERLLEVARASQKTFPQNLLFRAHEVLAPTELGPYADSEVTRAELVPDCATR
jgi:hypothetical protein